MFSPDVILCGLLGLKHQLTIQPTFLLCFSLVFFFSCFFSRFFRAPSSPPPLLLSSFLFRMGLQVWKIHLTVLNMVQPAFIRPVVTVDGLGELVLFQKPVRQSAKWMHSNSYVWQAIPLRKSVCDNHCLCQIVASPWISCTATISRRFAPLVQKIAFCLLLFWYAV